MNPEQNKQADKPNKREASNVAIRHREAQRRRLQRMVENLPMKTSKPKNLCFVALIGLLACGPVAAESASAAPHERYSAEELYNAGNSTFRAGKFGTAVLNYERARLLEPADPAIAANLRLAREKAGAPAPAWNRWESAAHRLTLDQWAWLGTLSLAALGAAVVVPRRHRFAARAGTVVACGVLLASGSAIALRWNELDRAIVIAPGVSARIAPAESAAAVCALPEGSAVTPRRIYGKFVRVNLADGRAGWVERGHIDTVIPGRMDDPVR